MAKANKQAKKQAQNKLSSKTIAQLRGLGENIVHATIDAGDSVAEKFFKVFGKSENELAEIGDGMASAWKAALVKLKKACSEYSGKLEARDSASAYSKQAQVYYNRASEGKAILKAFSIYAALPDGKAKKSMAKDIADMEHAPRRYDTLVMYARHVNNPAKRGTDKPQNAAVTRAKNAWIKRTSQQVKKMKDSLKFANLAGLLEIREFVEDRIALLKKREPADVIKLPKPIKRPANKQAQRKAA